MLEERDGSGSLSVSYVYGDDLISQERGGADSYYHYDALMSTRMLTNAAETVTDTYAYDAFGSLTDQTGITANDYLYTGEQYDANVGFYYLRARYYSPDIGRFTSQDPWQGNMFDSVSLHQYLYAGNNPVVFIDPSGGNYTITQIMVTGSIIGTLGGMTTGAVISWYRGFHVSDPAFWKYVGVGGFVGGAVSVFGIWSFHSLGLLPTAIITSPTVQGAVNWLIYNGNKMWKVVRPEHHWAKIANLPLPNIKNNVITNYRAILPHLQNIITSSGPTRIEPLANGGRLLIWEVTYLGQQVVVKIFENAQGIRTISNAWVK